MSFADWFFGPEHSAQDWLEFRRERLVIDAKRAMEKLSQIQSEMLVSSGRIAPMPGPGR